jgi:hypothetical protein
MTFVRGDGDNSVEHGQELRMKFSKQRAAWISTRFSLDAHHGAFSDHTENRGPDKRSAGFTNLIAYFFSLYYPYNALFISRFNAAPGKAIR